MDKKYIQLFRTLAQATAVSAEKVMEYNHQQKDEKNIEAVTTMRDDYQELVSAIDTAGDSYSLDRNAAARMLIAAMVQINQIQTRIDGLKKAIAGYQTDIIPKLQEIVDNTQDDEAARQMANEKFVILENNK